MTKTTEILKDMIRERTWTLEAAKQKMEDAKKAMETMIASDAYTIERWSVSNATKLQAAAQKVNGLTAEIGRLEFLLEQGEK